MSNLVWGGADCAELARKFGTPLYVFDESVIRARCTEVRDTFFKKWANVSACYASKAFLTTAMAKIIEREGLGLDVVSGGELYTALAANFPASRIELHGNSKSEEELDAALASGVGRIIIDGQMELELLAGLAAKAGRRQDILIRVAPGVNPHTHSHLVTGQSGSKFGLPIDGEILENAVSFAAESPHLNLKGFHFHIGSQIFENGFHIESVRRVVALIDKLKGKLGFETAELNFGGGFGVGKTPENAPYPITGGVHLPLAFFTDAMMEVLTTQCEAARLTRPAVVIEPGRWLVAEAGITLYKVETVKRLPGVTYVGVNGGMADNPRPSLYQAAYEAVVANKMGFPAIEKISLAGKCCETGDILIESVAFPEVGRGDIVAVFNTGAYNFSMAGNYNKLPRPAVVMTRDGDAREIVARQTYSDLLRGDSAPED